MLELRFVEALRVFRDARVDFVLVGDLFAVLNGAPIIGFYAEVVHSRDAASIEKPAVRLLAKDRFKRNGDEQVV